jgi:type VI secretion system secreted protein Hcp
MRHRRRSFAFLPLVLALASLPGLAFASGDLVILAQGATQGTIQGASTIQFHENWIDVFSFSHGVSVPTGANGLPTGPAITSPLSIMTRFDRSTIKMFRAQANQELFTIFRMEWVDAGTGQALFRYELTNARIIDAQESGSAGGDIAPTLSMSINYSRITITDLVQGTSMSYDWNSGSAATPPESVAKGILLTPAPNPTHGQTEFRFSLPADSNATLELFDLRGHRVRKVYSGMTSTDDTVAVWDGTDDRGNRVAQGIYVARLVYPGREVTQRITVLR